MQSLFRFLYLCALLSVTFSYPYRVINNTYLLSELTLPIAKSEIQNLVVYLHDPSCLPCKAFIRQFFEASALCSKTVQDPEIFSFAYVDVSSETQIPKDLDISHFPALIFYKDGHKYLIYDGPINAQAIFDWAYSNFELPVKTLENTNPYTIFGDRDLAVIYHGENDKGITAKILSGTKNTKNYLQVFRTESNIFGEKYGIVWGSIVVLSRYDEKYVQVFGKESGSYKTFDNVVDDQIAKLPKIFDPKLAKTMEETRNIFYAYFSKPGVSDFEERAAFLKVYNQLKLNQALFFRVDITTSLGATLAQILGIEDKQVPTIGILDTRKEVDRKYVLSGNIKSSDLLKFYEDAAINQKNQIRLSETIEPSLLKDQNHITRISRDSFLNTIRQSGKNLLILFCAPLEYQCRMFENTYRSLAYQLRDHSNIIVGTMDLTKNDVDIKIEDLPALAWYSEDHKDGLRYAGQYNIIYIKRWLQTLGVAFDD